MTYFVEQATEFSRDFELEACRSEELLAKAIIFLKEEVRETQEALEDMDHAEILDGAGDVAFIALNMIYKWGRISGRGHEDSTDLIYDVMGRICAANLGKKQPDGTVKRNENGKVIKPEDWQPPTYSDIIASST